MPLSALRRLVFPAPDGPIMAVRHPASKSLSTADRTVFMVAPRPTTAPSPRVLMATKRFAGTAEASPPSSFTHALNSPWPFEGGASSRSEKLWLVRIFFGIGA
jgi:hypothetical protein